MLSRRHRQTDEELRLRGRTAWLIVTGLVVVLVLYPLSIGPMSVVCHYANAHLVWDRVYLPVMLIGDAAGCDEAMLAYINWWLDVGGTDTFLSN